MKYLGSRKKIPSNSLRHRGIRPFSVFYLVIGLGLKLLTNVCVADPIAIANSGFEENPATVPSDITVGVPNAWSIYNPNGTQGVFYGSLYAAPDNYPAGAPEGAHVQVNFIAANRAAGEEFGVFQTLSATLEANTVYTLTVEVGNIASGVNDLNATPDNPNDDSFFNIAGFNGYRVELKTDSISGSGVTLMAISQSVEDGNNIPDGEFRTVSVVYDSRSADENLFGEELEILLVNLNEVDQAHIGSDRETNFDNVRLSSSPVTQNVAKVPTPIASLVVLGFGVVSLALSVQKNYAVDNR